MARVLLGPDGHPLVTTSPMLPDDVLAGAGLTVEKKVRAQATSLQSVWDRYRGKPKPTPVTYDTLRMMSHRNEWMRAIIKTRKNQIGKAPWSITPKDDDDKSSSTKRLCESMTQLLKRPSMHGSRPTSRSWRQFIGEVLEDLLVLDAGVIEKERDQNGWIVAMYPVDGATIRPNIDEYGGYQDDAYVQMVDGQVTARFGMEDLVFIMDNPLTDVRFAGYGFSPVENLILSVTAELFASKFNSSYFEKGSVPEGLLNLGEDVTPEDVDAFRLYWQNEIMGKPHAIPIVGGKGVGWEPWRAPNRDMQFMEYQSWLLKKMCAVMQISPQEVGELEDVNRSTADSQDDTNKGKSIVPILSLLHDYIEVEIIGPHGQGLGDLIQFSWDEDGDDEATINERYSTMVPVGAATRSEWRSALNMDPGDEDALDEFLVDGQQPVPLPTKEDLAVMGAKAQQDQAEKQAADQAQQQQNAQLGPKSSMPWKPATDGDPALLAAQQQHRAGASDGVGPVEPPAAPEDPDEKRAVGKIAREPERVLLHNLQVDPDYQRPMDRDKVARFARHRGTAKPIDVNRRPDGSHWITDGQHRAEAARVKGQTSILAHVTNLSTQDEHQATNIMAKTSEDGHDRNPAITAQQDSLDGVLRRKHQDLVDGLASILNLSPALLDQQD